MPQSTYTEDHKNKYPHWHAWLRECSASDRALVTGSNGYKTWTDRRWSLEEAWVVACQQAQELRDSPGGRDRRGEYETNQKELGRLAREIHAERLESVLATGTDDPTLLI